MKRRIIFILLLAAVFVPLLYSQEISPEEIYKNTHESVVMITSYAQDSSVLKTGSGIIVSTEGIIYTNFHVVSEAERIEVKKKGRS